MKIINLLLGKLSGKCSNILSLWRAKQQEKEIRKNKKLLLNIGSGNWECPGWICLDYPSEWYSKAQSGHKIVPYDIRSESIPYSDNSVDAIYCSHVVEHIENHHIQRFFQEVHRVLKEGGVFRVCCPDAEFLYEVAKSGKLDYWYWRKSWFSSPRFWQGRQDVKPVDYLVREVATPKLKGYVNAIDGGVDVSREFDNMPMVEFLDFLTNDLEFRNDYVGDHINFWTYEKMKEMLQHAGFDIVIRSKWHASVCRYMENLGYFDKTAPHMSLYVEAVKQ